MIKGSESSSARNLSCSIHLSSHAAWTTKRQTVMSLWTAAHVAPTKFVYIHVEANSTVFAYHFVCFRRIPIDDQDHQCRFGAGCHFSTPVNQQTKFAHSKVETTCLMHRESGVGEA